MAKKTIEDVNLKNKKVLMRCDFNVPLDQIKILPMTGVSRLPCLQSKKYCAENGALILCSHLGRPKGQVKQEMSLKAGRRADCLALLGSEKFC